MSGGAEIAQNTLLEKARCLTLSFIPTAKSFQFRRNLKLKFLIKV